MDYAPDGHLICSLCGEPGGICVCGFRDAAKVRELVRDRDEAKQEWQTASRDWLNVSRENERLRTAIRGVARHDGWLFWWYEDENEYGVAIFVPAADCENVDWLDVPEVIRIADESGYDGLVEWVRNRRALAEGE